MGHRASTMDATSPTENDGTTSLGASSMWARALLRANWRATIALALFAGLAGAASMTAWEIARRGDAALPNYLRFSDIPDADVLVCPPGIKPSDVPPGEDLATFCTHDDRYGRVARDRLATSRLVESVGRTAPYMVSVNDTNSRSGHVRHLPYVSLDGYADDEHLYVLAGRLPSDDAPNEIVVNEQYAAAGAPLGSTLEITPYPTAQFSDGESGTVRATGVARPANVVGIVRTLDSIMPAPFDRSVPNVFSDYDLQFYAGPGWWEVNGPDIATDGVYDEVRLRPDASVDELQAELATLFPGQTAYAYPKDLSPTEAPIRRVIRLQSRGALGVAWVALVAALGFVGQALGRQVDREMRGHDRLQALGLSRRANLAAVVLRALPLALPAGAVAIAITWFASAIGPVGVARRAELHPGRNFDMLVSTTGFVIVLVSAVLTMVFAAALAPGKTARSALRRSPARASGRTTGRSPTMAALLGSPSRLLGVRLLRPKSVRSPLRAARVGTMVGVATIVSSFTLAATMTSLLAHPMRYGVMWDYNVGNFSSPGAYARGVAVARRSGTVTDAVGFNSSGIIIRGKPVVVQDFAAIRGTITPRILAGRVPRTNAEIALAPKTMTAVGAHLGSSLPITRTDGKPGTTMRVVGTVLLSDGISTGPGYGAMVAPGGVERLVDDSGGSENLLVRVRSGLTRAEAVDGLERDFPNTVLIPVVPGDVDNLRQMSAVPRVIGALVALLASAALLHALLTTARRNRRSLAVARALGLERVGGVIRWHAAVVAAPGIVGGGILGLLAGRAIWIALARRVGFIAAPVLPLRSAVFVVVVALGIALSAATAATARASGESTAVLLAAE